VEGAEGVEGGAVGAGEGPEELLVGGRVASLVVLLALVAAGGSLSPPPGL
jgi:hypothetical protein